MICSQEPVSITIERQALEISSSLESLTGFRARAHICANSNKKPPSELPILRISMRGALFWKGECLCHNGQVYGQPPQKRWKSIVPGSRHSQKFYLSSNESSRSDEYESEMCHFQILSVKELCTENWLNFDILTHFVPNFPRIEPVTPRQLTLGSVN